MTQMKQAGPATLRPSDLKRASWQDMQLQMQSLQATKVPSVLQSSQPDSFDASSDICMMQVQLEHLVQETCQQFQAGANTWSYVKTVSLCSPQAEQGQELLEVGDQDFAASDG